MPVRSAAGEVQMSARFWRACSITMIMGSVTALISAGDGVHAVEIDPTNAELIARGQRDDQGRRNYVITIDESYMNARGSGDEPPARHPEDERNAVEWRGWHRPETRRVVKELEKAYDIKALTMTSWGIASFSAFIHESQLEALRSDPRIERLVLNGWAQDYASWTDQMVGGQFISWGKDAIGTNDVPQSTTNIVYVVDGGASTTSDLWMSIAPVNTGYTAFPDHAYHVMGIMGAKGTPRNMLGVNPNSPMILVKKGDLDAETETALDWVIAHNENLGRFSVTNISSASNRYNYDGVFGKWLRLISNRSLVVLAGGNYGVGGGSACANTYGVNNDVDGILVVGAMEKNGGRSVPISNSHAPPYGGSATGSSYGNCMEVCVSFPGR